MVGHGRLYLTRADLEVLRIVYPDTDLGPVPTWHYLQPRVANAYAVCIDRWVRMEPGHELSTVATMLAGDFRALGHAR